MATRRKLRSRAWFGWQDKVGFYDGSVLKNHGTPQDPLDGRPVIGICGTWSALAPRDGHFRDLARTGVLAQLIGAVPTGDIATSMAAIPP